MSTIIINIAPAGAQIAELLHKELPDSKIIARSALDSELFESSDNIIFIGALGICVRTIAPLLKSKETDPGVVCVDSLSLHAIAVTGGHIGGANEVCRKVARITGAQPVVTTQSDCQNLWALDTLAHRWGWIADADHDLMNRAIFTFVSGKPVALLLDIHDRGTEYLESTLPPHVKVYDSFDLIPQDEVRLIIAVTPYIFDSRVPVLYFRKKVISVGIGCRRGCDSTGVADYIISQLEEEGISPRAVGKVATIELKKDEPLVNEVAEALGCYPPVIFTADDLADLAVPNPSEKVKEVTGVWGVAESCAIKAASGGKLLLEKQKCCLKEGADFTFAVAVLPSGVGTGHIEIVGAGPGDPELVSVRGKRFLSEADLILYAGSLVPEELTHYAKEGCVVRSSASMALEEQLELMHEFYDRGLKIVRLHTGDPCIYGAIQEQMAYFDLHGMDYHITPGISSFQAAAAELRSQFTIPEKVQSIILTRGEGRTPMPEKEQLHKLAQSQSTMCIYLSAGIVDEVQSELLKAYPPETPVAACYKLTWKEQRIYRGQLKDLAKIVKENNLKLTTLLVVGDAIDNRSGYSKLYDDSFKHLFRK